MNTIIFGNNDIDLRDRMAGDLVTVVPPLVDQGVVGVGLGHKVSRP